MTGHSRWTAIAAVGALGAGALALPAIAHEDDAVPATAAAGHTDADGVGTGLRAEVRQRADELLAEELGVRVEELRAAREATREQLAEEFGDEFAERREQRRDRMLQRVDTALENGRITEDEADVLRQRIEDGEPPFGGLRARLHRSGGA